MTEEEISPKNLLLGILDELEDPMCQMIADNVPAYEEIRDWVVDLKSVIDIVKKREGTYQKIMPFEEVNKWFSEYGCTVCYLGENGAKLTDCRRQESSGTHVTISKTTCIEAGGNPIGSYHTHPFMLPLPSAADINNQLRGESIVDFIGGKVGDRDVIVGYGSFDSSLVKYKMEQKIDPYPGDIWEGAKGAVCMWKVPSDSQGANVSAHVGVIPVYDDATQRRQFYKQIEYLKRSFSIVVQWC